MSTTHDPPAHPGAATIPAALLAVFNEQGFEKYQLLRDRLDEEPMERIHRMVTGTYRIKRRRNGDPVPDQTDPTGNTPTPDYMSFRKIAIELQGTAGVAISYETVRRWWYQVWPEDRGRGFEDGTPEAAERIQARLARLHTAQAEASARHTNEAVPPAAFLAPDEAPAVAHQHD